MINSNYKEELNILINRQIDFITQEDIKSIINYASKIEPYNPFCLICNYEEVIQSFNKYRLTLAYGGVRTGSTFIYNLLKIILNSISKDIIFNWSGDFKTPEKFLDFFYSHSNLKFALLKIHETNKSIFNEVKNDRAKAIISIRDYPSIGKSFWRMSNNIHSPFFNKNIELKHVISFIRNQINEEYKRRDLKNSLFVKENLISNHPSEVINSVSKFLNINIHSISKNFLVDAVKKETLLKKQKSLTLNSTLHDKETFLHKNHISENDLKNEISEKIEEEVWDNFGNELDSKGYLK